MSGSVGPGPDADRELRRPVWRRARPRQGRAHGHRDQQRSRQGRQQRHKAAATADARH